MTSILFNEIVFGPLKSRRLGLSLGINLLPYDGKLCSFDCIYCECGYNNDHKTKTKLPNRDNVKAALEDKLISLQAAKITPDVITFAGNGEPTMHPQFAEIINDTIDLKNKYFPSAKISVLSNGMFVGRGKVFDALKKVDNNILKLDSAFDETVRLLDKPNSLSYSVDHQIELFKNFEGNFTLQTLFTKGMHNGHIIDNTTEDEISAWLEAVKATKPKEVMIYTIDRETPEKSLEKVSIDVLKKIGDRVKDLGIKVNIAG